MKKISLAIAIAIMMSMFTPSVMAATSYGVDDFTNVQITTADNGSAYPSNWQKVAGGYAVASKAVTDTRDEAKELTEEVLSEWRMREDVRKEIEKIISCITVEYQKFETGKKDEEENYNQGFIKINVAVLNDFEFAKSPSATICIVA